MSASSELSKGICLVGGLLLKIGGGAAVNVFSGTINTSTTWATQWRALPGSLLIDTTGKKLYINTGTKASPTWTVVGSQS